MPIDFGERIRDMQLLYGNDGINYHTIAKSAEMTESQEKELLSSYLGYDFVRDTEHYSSPSAEPISLVYVTTNLSNHLPEEKILLARNGRMTNYITPSYWAHFQFVDMDLELYGERFFELLHQSFVADKDLCGYLTRNIDEFQRETIPMFINENAVEQEKLIVIVAAVLNVADSLSKQVKLVLDVEGDSYNERALEVVASVYKCLPCNVRRRAGFSTYIGAQSGSSNRVKLQLYTRAALGELGAEALDLREMDVQAELCKLPQNMVALARDFVTQEDTVRREWFQSFQTVFGINAVSVEEHIRFYQNIRKWQEQELDELLDRAALYALQEVNREERTPVFLMFCNILEKRFLKEQYEQKYQVRLIETLQEQSDFHFSRKLMAYVALGEAIPGVNLPQKAFLEWEQKKIVGVLETSFEETELINAYKEAYMQLHGIRCGSTKFPKIQSAMEGLIKERVGAVNEEIKRRMAEEKEKCLQLFADREIILTDLPQLQNAYEGIKYEETRNAFSESLFDNIRGSLCKLSCFKSYGSYREYGAFIKKMQTYLSTEQMTELQKLAEEKGQAVKAMEIARQIEWNHRNHILESYQNVSEMRALATGKDVEVPDYVLKVNRKEFLLREQELLGLMSFLLVPTERNSRQVDKLLSGGKMDLLEALFAIEAFGSEHFSYLFGFESGKVMQKDILCYYMESEQLLTMEQIENGLRGTNLRSLLQYLPEKNRRNILALAIKEKCEKQSVVTEQKQRKNKSNVWKVGIIAGCLLLLLAVGGLLALMFLRERSTTDRNTLGTETSIGASVEAGGCTNESGETDTAIG